MKAIMGNGNIINVYDGKIWGYDVSRYGIEHNILDYRSLINAMTDGCYILNNELIKILDDVEIYSGETYYEDETGEEIYLDEYQYYIISGNAADNLARYTNEIVYYSEKADIYFLAVTHWGTSWDYVETGYELIDEE